VLLQNLHRKSQFSGPVYSAFKLVNDWEIATAI